MPYLADLHTYLHQSSLLVQAYPSARVTTKYSLPRKPKAKGKDQANAAPATDPTAATHQKREPSATLTLKTYHPESGICLKYRTDKAAEVGRLLTGLGRLAKGEVIDMPSAGAPTSGGDKMDIDAGTTAPPKVEDKIATATAAASQGGAPGGSGGKGKKKTKGKR